MKTKLSLIVLLSLFFVGCSGREPNALEQALFDVNTRSVPIVSLETNVSQTPDGPVTTVTSVTNWFEAIDLTPNETANAMVQTGGNIGDLFGVGGIVSTLLTSILGIWAKLRSNTNRKTAAILAQVIEAGRNVMTDTPQGNQLEKQWVAWMSKHQTQAGVVLEVSKLVKKVVDKDSAKAVAGDLIQIVQKSQVPKPQQKK